MNTNSSKIYSFLLEGIAQGRYAPDDRIPTEEELGGMFSTHRLNAHYAVRELQAHGILRRNHKQGTFVNHVPTPYVMGELKSKITRRVCVLNTTESSHQHIHWNPRLITPLEVGLRQANIDIMFEDVSALKSTEEYRTVLSGLISQGFNALLLIPNYSPGQADSFSIQPDLLFEFHNNVFIFDRGIHHWSSWPYNIVSINVFGEGAIVAQYLVSQKMEHVIFCHTGEPEQLWLAERMNGFRFGMQREAHAGREMICRQFDMDKPNSAFFREIRKLIKSGRTAVVAQNDEAAAAIIDQAAEQGLQAGRDLSVIGFDDNSKYQSYNITTVSPSLELIGQQLSDMIRNSLDHEDCSVIACNKINSQLKIRATG